MRTLEARTIRGSMAASFPLMRKDAIQVCHRQITPASSTPSKVEGGEVIVLGWCNRYVSATESSKQEIVLRN